MRVRPGLAAFILLATVSGQALALPATPEGAAKLTTDLQAYFTAEPGVVGVTPNGEAYDLKLDFNPLFAKHKGADFEGQISPLNMKVADQGGGKWQVTQDEGVSFKFKTLGAEMTGTIAKLSGISIYDEALGLFESGKSDIADFTFEQTTTAPGQQPIHSSTKMKSAHYETSASSAGSGADATAKMNIDGLAQEIAAPMQAGAPPMPITITTEKVTQDSTIKGLRAAPLKSLIAWAIANSGAPDINAKQPELKQRIVEALPMFDNLSGVVTYQNANVLTPIGPIGLAAATVNLGMSGLVQNGSLQETFSFEGLSLPPGLIPPFATDLVPQKLTVDFKLSDFNLADSAKMFVEQVDFASKADLPAELSAKLMAALLPSGAVTIATSGTSALAKAYDLKIDGSMKAGPAARPSGAATVSLKGFDEVVKALQAAPPQMGLQQAMGSLVVAKGMAKQDGDRLNWTIESTPAGGVLVNGIDVMKMGGGG
jgi:hypothetical protein